MPILLILCVYSHKAKQSIKAFVKEASDECRTQFSSTEVLLQHRFDQVTTKNKRCPVATLKPFEILSGTFNSVQIRCKLKQLDPNTGCRRVTQESTC